MPVYNERDTVEEIARKVKDAPLPIELIVVDDGSTDGSREILRRLDEEGVVDRLVLNDENRGKKSSWVGKVICVERARGARS